MRITLLLLVANSLIFCHSQLSPTQESCLKERNCKRTFEKFDVSECCTLLKGLQCCVKKCEVKLDYLQEYHSDNVVKCEANHNLTNAKDHRCYKSPASKVWLWIILLILVGFILVCIFVGCSKDSTSSSSGRSSGGGYSGVDGGGGGGGGGDGGCM
jgi:hypothetical protein